MKLATFVIMSLVSLLLSIGAGYLIFRTQVTQSKTISYPITPGIPVVAEAFEYTNPEASLAGGKWTVLSFGYTHCPDICPATMAQLAAILNQSSSTDLQVVFVTIAPEVDSLGALAAYREHFHPSIIGARGEAAALAKLASSLATTFDYIEGDNDNTFHSSYYYLINPKGEWVGYYKPEEHSSQAIAGDLSQLISTQETF
jgi:protein SCO1